MTLAIEKTTHIAVLNKIEELTQILEKNYIDWSGGRTTFAKTYAIEEGKKFFKIIQCDNDGSQSVHAFVEKSTGDLYKAASWKAAAKGARYNLFEDIGALKTLADWAGSYLYK